MKHLIVLSALFLNLTYSQVQVSWFNSYISRSSNYESLKSKSDNKGNTYLAGRRYSSFGQGYFAAMYNTTGELKWINTYDADGKFSLATDITTDNSGNVYITGESLESEDNWDIVTIKYNSAGEQLWINKFDAGGGELGFGITMDPTNNSVYVAGQKTSAFGNGNDGIVMKLSAVTGVKSWHTVINLAKHEDVRHVQTDNAGNVYIAGVSGPLDNLDILTAKLNSAGTVLWAKRYNGTGNSGDIAKGLEVSGDGEVFVTGTSVGTGNTFDFATLNYGTTGNLKWIARYDGVDNLTDEAKDIAIDKEKNTYVTGYTTFSGGYKYARTMKYNSAGTEEWGATYMILDPQSISSGNSIITDPSGNVYISGYSGRPSNLDIMAIKYNSSGAEQWQFTYDNTSIDESNNINPNIEDGSILLSGNVSDGIFGIFAMKLKPNTFDNTSLKPGRDNVPSRYRLYQNYPNPFNPSTKIVFDIPDAQFVKLAIYDAAGKTISTLVNSPLNAGTYEITVSNDIIPASGVYFYKLESGSFTDIKKMVMIK